MDVEKPQYECTPLTKATQIISIQFHFRRIIETNHAASVITCKCFHLLVLIQEDKANVICHFPKLSVKMDPSP